MLAGADAAAATHGDVAACVCCLLVFLVVESVSVRVEIDGRLRGVMMEVGGGEEKQVGVDK